VSINVSLSVSLAFFLRYTSAKTNTKTSGCMIDVFLSSCLPKRLKIGRYVSRSKIQKHHVPVRSSKRPQSPANELRFPVAWSTHKYTTHRVCDSSPRLLCNTKSTKIRQPPTNVCCPNNFGKHWMCSPSSSVRKKKSKMA